jgi:hypothetical protein
VIGKLRISYNPILDFHFILRYEYDTDHLVSQLNIFDAESGDPMGIINWFAVHPTSMNNTNKYNDTI